MRRVFFSSDFKLWLYLGKKKMTYWFWLFNHNSHLLYMNNASHVSSLLVKKQSEYSFPLSWCCPDSESQNVVIKFHVSSAIVCHQGTEIFSFIWRLLTGKADLLKGKISLLLRVVILMSIFTAKLEL